jgi:hypothetical protein
MCHRADDFACQLRHVMLHLLQIGDIDGGLENPLLFAHKEWNTAAFGIRPLVPRCMAQDIP